MSNESEASEYSDDTFIFDLSRRDSDLQYKPRGIEVSALVYNAILLDLENLDIPGPLDFNECISDMKFLGAGALFEVYGLVVTVHATFPSFDGPEAGIRAFDHTIAKAPESQKLVAIKRAKIIETQDSYGSCISLKTRSDDLADVNHLNLLRTEIATISAHKHPNIVSLLAWGFETFSDPVVNRSKRSFFLVLEHALGSAEKVLKAVDFPLAMKSHLSAGVVDGLKALHEYQTIHGDIKPENVLIFGTLDTEYGLVSKIADFNFSWSELRRSRIPRGTFGWAAPELEEYDSVTPDLRRRLHAADAWSLALTVWSMLFEHGSPISFLSPMQYAPRLQAVLDRSELSHIKQEQLRNALSPMLEPDALKRAIELDGLRMALATPKEYTIDESILQALRSSVEAVIETSESSAQNKVTLKPKAYPKHIYNFESSSIPLRETRSSWCHSRRTIYKGRELANRGESFQGDRLAHLFSVAASSNLDNRYWERPRMLGQRCDELMLQVAMRGYFPAQAWVIVFWYKQEEAIPPHIHPYLDRWNFNAIASGFLFSPWRLQLTKPPMYEQAKSLFRNMGGYNLHYCGKDMAYWDAAQPGHGECVSGLVGLLERDLLGHPLHLAAALNNPQLGYMIATDSWAQQVHAKDENGDTPLMKCCMAGHIEALRDLVSAKSDASMMNEIFGYTASHWLFNFPDEHVEEAILLLVQANADLTARNRKAISAFHVPFGWPSGTPLHWAIFADNQRAVASIIRHSPATMDQIDCSGMTPLHMTMKMLNSSLLEILLASGADLHGARLKNVKEYFCEDQASTTTSSSGNSLDPTMTPVHDFLSHSLDLDAYHYEDNSMYLGYWLPSNLRFDLFRAGQYVEGVNDVLSAVLTHAPNCLFWRDSEDKHPLHYFLSGFQSVIEPEVLELLLQYGPGLHENEESQLSPLNLLFINHPFALQDETLSIVLRKVLHKMPEAMCAHFLNRRHTRPHWSTFLSSTYREIGSYRPIHFAAELGLPKCLQLFVAFGADPAIRTEDTNLTAADVAVNAINYAPTSPLNSSPSSRMPSPLPLENEMNRRPSLDGNRDIADSLERLNITGADAEGFCQPRDVDEQSSGSDSQEYWGRDEETIERKVEMSKPEIHVYENLRRSLKNGNEGRLRCIELLKTYIDL